MWRTWGVEHACMQVVLLAVDAVALVELTDAVCGDHALVLVRATILP